MLRPIDPVKVQVLGDLLSETVAEIVYDVMCTLLRCDASNTPRVSSTDRKKKLSVYSWPKALETVPVVAPSWFLVGRPPLVYATEPFA